MLWGQGRGWGLACGEVEEGRGMHTEETMWWLKTGASEHYVGPTATPMVLCGGQMLRGASTRAAPVYYAGGHMQLWAVHTSRQWWVVCGGKGSSTAVTQHVSVLDGPQDGMSSLRSFNRSLTDLQLVKHNEMYWRRW